MVEWDNFILAFGEHMNMKPTALSPDSTMIQCAKLILGNTLSLHRAHAPPHTHTTPAHGLTFFDAAVASKDITTSDTNKRFAVTLESYARFLHIFGPLRPTILSDVRTFVLLRSFSLRFVLRSLLFALHFFNVSTCTSLTSCARLGASTV